MPRSPKSSGPKPKPYHRVDLSDSSLNMVIAGFAPKTEPGTAPGDTSSFSDFLAPSEKKPTPSVTPSLGPEADTKPESDDRKPRAAKKSNKSAGKSGGKSGPWSGDEYIAVFNAATAKVGGPASFNDAVPGRTGKQAYLAWRQVVQGVCTKALKEKGV